MLRAVEIKANKAGKRYALVYENDTGLFGVYAECRNYQRGRIVAAWRYCERKMSESDAMKLFDRKVAGGKK